jgi:hypothetical protein
VYLCVSFSSNLMNLPSTKQFFLDLFSPGPFPGHGVRVNVPGPLQAGMLSGASLDDRVRLAREEFLFERECAEKIGDDRIPMLHAWTGTEIFAAAFGSPVQYPVDNMPFALPAVYDATGADALPDPDLTSGPLAEVLALLDRLVNKFGDDQIVRICDIQSPFDISALIWKKEAFFQALVETPESAHRLLEKVTRFMIGFLHAFKERYRQTCLVHFPDLWLPPEWGICLSEDDVGSISPRHFEQFALPYLQCLAEEFGGISIHSCASAQHQWDGFLRLPNIHYMNLFHPPTDLATSIEKFSGRAVLAPMFQVRQGKPYNGHDTYLECVRECLSLARPDTRFFFITDAPAFPEAHELARELKSLCGRSSHL